MSETSRRRASQRDDAHPRPQLVRDSWVELAGVWEFEYDDSDVGRAEGWESRAQPFAGVITVPFPPESAASGIGDTGYHRVLWYRRSVTAADLDAAGHRPDRTLVLHFGAVDYEAEVWIDGRLAGRHVGGHTPFSVIVGAPRDGFEIVVRAQDDPHDLAQPRGKQDWELEPHVVWYARTSGIWQPVWIESVPVQHLVHLAWRPDVAAAAVELEFELARGPLTPTTLRVELVGSVPLATIELDVTEIRGRVSIPVPALRNGQARETLMWSPEHPVLIDAVVRLAETDGEADEVQSYFGFRSVATTGEHFLLNDRPHRIRGVLSQGYWPRTHLAAPSGDSLRAEAQLIKDLGFTTVRVHQKIEDPRFLYWADRLGLLVWEEMPSAYEFSTTAASRLASEWAEVLRRDSSHPSIVVWVPFNESWGVQDVASSARQRALVRALVELARTVDGTRPVVSNDGWEHTSSDLLTVHDYENDAVALVRSYGTPEAARQALADIAPNGRRMVVGTSEERDMTLARPVVLSEFGGVSIAASGAWGYRELDSRDELGEHLSSLFAAVESPGLAGWCYTQLTDTAQETNGLADENRIPKVPIERLRAMITGGARPGAPIDDSLPRASAGGG